MISIIAAVSEDLGIGKDNKLLWRLPEDMKRFKKLTMGNTVIMGKKTWESLPKKPLAGRKNIIITDIPGEHFDFGVAAYSIEDALAKCEKGEDIFIIGGGSIYRQFMPVADKLYITLIHSKVPADVYFPEIEPKIWKVTEQEEFKPASGEGIRYSYIIYERQSG